MTEDTNGVAKSAVNGEMSPQEDGTKVLLAGDSGGASVEVKCADLGQAAPKGGVAVDIGDTPTFSGLSKNELMKYSNDPFWVKLRWVLFILFWVGWLAMLVVAIVIIILTPSCPPQPKLEWVEEKPMVQYSDLDYPTEDFQNLMKKLGLDNSYIPDVIEATNFDDFDSAFKGKLETLTQALKEANIPVVTDFVDDVLPDDHSWVLNPNTSHLFLDDERTLNYSNPDLIDRLKNVLRGWADKGVKGFLMADMTEEKIKAKKQLNEELEEDGVVIGSGIVDLKDVLPTFPDENVFDKFLKANVGGDIDRKFFMYNPFDLVGRGSLTHNHIPLVTLGLFLTPSTSVFKVTPTNIEVNTTLDVITHMSKSYLDQNAIKFGNTTFLNITEAVSYTGYTRTALGVPSYAVAVNLGSSGTTINFAALPRTPKEGKLSMEIINGGIKDLTNENKEMNLSELPLPGLSAKVIEFNLEQEE